MSEKYKVRDSLEPHFITVTVVDWIDLFIRQEYKDIIIDNLKYCQEHKGLVIHAYVVMSSHFHAIVSAKGGCELPAIIRDFKKHTSKKLVKKIKWIHESRRDWILEQFSREAGKIKRVSKYKVWQDGFHPIELSNAHMLKQRLGYLHCNPVAERIVDNEEDYVYSSARQYAGKPGLLDVEYLT